MTEDWRNPDALFCNCGQEFDSMDKAGNHWDQFSDHTIKDRSGNVHFQSVKEINLADYQELNNVTGEWECRCGKQFHKMGDMLMHVNGTHRMDKDVRHPLGSY